MNITVVVPIYNEHESLPELCSWIQRVMEEHHYSYEIIIVDDGSNDGSWEVIEKLAKTDQYIKGIKFRKNHGKSAALHTGFQYAAGDVVITMDGDLQDNPDEIPGLYQMITRDGYDMVSGWKKKRYDPISKTLPSKFYNYTARCITGIKLHDFNCGLKAYRNIVVKSIEVYGEMHRYIPVLAKKAGFGKIGEKVVNHRKRQYGTTKFGMERFINGFLDLLSITFISKFGRRPMHLFGSLGTLMFIIGLLAAVWLGFQKIYYLQHQIKSRLVTESPYFYIALTVMIIGTQLFLAGFLGELIHLNSNDRNDYKIEKTINDFKQTGDK